MKSRTGRTDYSNVWVFRRLILVANCETKRDFELLHPESQLDFLIRYQYEIKCACLLVTYFTVPKHFLRMLTACCRRCKGGCEKDQINSESSRSLAVRNALRNNLGTFAVLYY